MVVETSAKIITAVVKTFSPIHVARNVSATVRQVYANFVEFENYIGLEVTIKLRFHWLKSVTMRLNTKPTIYSPIFEYANLSQVRHISGEVFPSTEQFTKSYSALRNPLFSNYCSGTNLILNRGFEAIGKCPFVTALSSPEVNAAPLMALLAPIQVTVVLSASGQFIQYVN